MDFVTCHQDGERCFADPALLGGESHIQGFFLHCNNSFL